MAVEFIQVFLEDEVADELAAFGGEGELVGGHELLDDDAGHHFFGVGGIGEELCVLGDAGVGFGLEGGEGFEEFALVGGGLAFFHEALVEAGVFFVVGVFGAEELVFPLQLAGAGVDVREGGDVFAHFVGGDLAEVAGAEQAFEFLAERDEFRVARIKVPGEALAGAAEDVAEFVGDAEFGLGDFAEGEEDFFEGDVEQAGFGMAGFEGLALVEKSAVLRRLVGVSGFLLVAYSAEWRMLERLLSSRMRFSISGSSSVRISARFRSSSSRK